MGSIRNKRFNVKGVAVVAAGAFFAGALLPDNINPAVWVKNRLKGGAK